MSADSTTSSVRPNGSGAAALLAAGIGSLMVAGASLAGGAIVVHAGSARTIMEKNHFIVTLPSVVTRGPQAVIGGLFQ